MDSRLELRRKSLHMLTGAALIALVYFSLIGPLFALGLFLLHLLLSLACLRTRLPGLSWCLKSFGRPGEFPGRGSLTYIFALFLLLLLFQGRPEIVLASLAILALGDALPAISVIFFRWKGIRLRRHIHNREKYVEPTIIGLVLCSIAAALFVPLVPAVVAASAAMLVESLDYRRVFFLLDDNITVPLTASAVLWVFYFVL